MCNFFFLAKSFFYHSIKTAVNEELEYLKTTPGAYLGSCRYKLPEDLEDAVYPKLFQKFEELEIGYFFYIGGNDSMDLSDIMELEKRLH